MDYNILIIEDAYLESVILSQNLLNKGFNIVHLFKPEILFEEYDISRYDIIITDISLVDSIDGYEVCRRITQLNSGIPIIVRSVNMYLKEEVEKAFINGASDVIAKGHKMQELFDMIEKWGKISRERLNE